MLLFSQSGTFGATFAITDTAPDATGPDTTVLDSDRVTPAAPMDCSFLGYIGHIGWLFVGAAAPDAVVLALPRGQRGRSSGTNRPSDET